MVNRILKTLKDQSPYINTAISGICFLIIIFPIFLSADLLLKVSDIIAFRKAYLPHLIIVFLLSTIFAGSHGIKRYVEKARKKKKAAEEREKKLILLKKIEELYNPGSGHKTEIIILTSSCRQSF